MRPALFFPLLACGRVLAVTAALLFVVQQVTMAASIIPHEPPNPLPLDRAKIVGDARFRPTSVKLTHPVTVTLVNGITQETYSQQLMPGDVYNTIRFRLTAIEVMVGRQHVTVPWESTDAMDRAEILARKAVDYDTEKLLVPPPPPNFLEALAYQDHEGDREPSYKKERKNPLRNRYKEYYLYSDRWTRNQAIPKVNDPLLSTPKDLSKQ
ncbi:hypothetical protein DB346_19785 [Verrucomicrobia bacterium LW23]|nr:hypothetical protein DB346_19785 [Verrucomicrobia bacterium LW23]